MWQNCQKFLVVQTYLRVVFKSTKVMLYLRAVFKSLKVRLHLWIKSTKVIVQSSVQKKVMLHPWEQCSKVQRSCYISESKSTKVMLSSVLKYKASLRVVFTGTYPEFAHWVSDHICAQSARQKIKTTPVIIWNSTWLVHGITTAMVMALADSQSLTDWLGLCIGSWLDWAQDRDCRAISALLHIWLQYRAATHGLLVGAVETKFLWAPPPEGCFQATRKLLRYAPDLKVQL